MCGSSKRWERSETFHSSRPLLSAHESKQSVSFMMVHVMYPPGKLVTSTSLWSASDRGCFYVHAHADWWHGYRVNSSLEHHPSKLLQQITIQCNVIVIHFYLTWGPMSKCQNIQTTLIACWSDLWFTLSQLYNLHSCWSGYKSVYNTGWPSYISEADCIAPEAVWQTQQKKNCCTYALY